MSENTSPVEPSAAGSGWFSRHPRLRMAARICAAAWCGAYVAAAAAVLTTPVWGGGTLDGEAAMLALAFFSLIVAIIICRQRDALPRYGFVVGSVFSLWIVPPEWRLGLALGLTLPLILWLFFRCRGGRWTVWLLVVIGVTFLELRPLYDESLPEAAYLPISLLSGRKRVRILTVGEDIMNDWWTCTRYVRRAAAGPADVAVAGGGTVAPLLSLFDIYGMISRGDAYRRGVYRYLLGRLEPDGVLVMPVRELHLLPEGDWRFAPLPGAGEDWLAARRGKAPVTDPEELDKRLQQCLEYVNDEDFPLPAGAFAALYYAPQVKPIHFEPRPERPVPLDRWWRWLAGGAFLYFCIRLLICRRECRSVAVAAWENALALTLFTLGSVKIVGEAEFFTGVSPQLLFCGFGIFLLPIRPGRWGGRLLNVAGMAALLLPLAFSGNAVLLWCCWLMIALSATALREGLGIESPRIAAIWSVLGAVSGGMVYALLLIFKADTLAAAATICFMFRVGTLFRHRSK